MCALGSCKGWEGKESLCCARRTTLSALHGEQACKLKFRLRDLNSCLCSAAALAVSFEGCMSGLNATETGSELSQPKFQFTSLMLRQRRRNGGDLSNLEGHKRRRPHQGSFAFAGFLFIAAGQRSKAAGRGPLQGRAITSEPGSV